MRKSNNVTQLDLINARTSVAFKEVAGVEIPIEAAAVSTDPTKPDDDTLYGYIWDTDGTCYAGNSQAVREAIEQIIPLIDEGAKLTGVIISKQSRSGKEFLALKLSDRK